MKDIELKLKYKSIEQRIQTYTYYTGEARKQTGLPQPLVARIQASSDDNTQLGDHIETAVAELSTIISRYLPACSACEKQDEANGEKIIVFKLQLPALYPLATLPQIEKTMENYTVKRTLQQWFQQHQPQEAAIIAAEAQTLTLQLRDLLTLRHKPSNKKRTDNNIIDL